MKNDTHLNMRISKELMDRLKVAADFDGRSVSNAVRYAIEEYIMNMKIEKFLEENKRVHKTE